MYMCVPYNINVCMYGYCNVRSVTICTYVQKKTLKYVHTYVHLCTVQYEFLYVWVLYKMYVRIYGYGAVYVRICM